MTTRLLKVQSKTDLMLQLLAIIHALTLIVMKRSSEQRANMFDPPEATCEVWHLRGLESRGRKGATQKPLHELAQDCHQVLELTIVL